MFPATGVVVRNTRYKGCKFMNFQRALPTVSIYVYVCILSSIPSSRYWRRGGNSVKVLAEGGGVWQIESCQFTAFQSIFLIKGRAPGKCLIFTLTLLRLSTAVPLGSLQRDALTRDLIFIQLTGLMVVSSRKDLFFVESCGLVFLWNLHVMTAISDFFC
jgi:hypothetical protein